MTTDFQLKWNWKTGLAVFLLAFGILFLRRAGSITRPQFWAEDGREWYSNAYNMGSLRSLVRTQDGYFQTLSRVTADVSKYIPFSRAPLLFNLVAVIMEILPVLLVISPRFKKIIPSDFIRICLTLLYLLLPNTAEVAGNLTNAQWYLALLGCLVILAEPPETLLAKYFDAAALVLCGLTGPFAIFLLPIAALMWWQKKDEWKLNLFFMTLACALIQIAGLLFFSGGGRVRTVRQMSFRLFFAILNRQVFMGTVLGSRGYLWVLAHTSWYFWLFVATAVLGLVLTGYAVLKAGFEQKLFILFATLLFCVSLLNPTVGAKRDLAWKILSRSYAGARYWLIPMLAFLTVLFFCAKKSAPLILRSLALLFLCFMVVGVVMDFRYPAFTNFHFDSYASQLNAAPPWAKVRIPINPPGWDMILIKR